MIDIVLDISILRQDPKREKAAFRALKRLCWQKKVQLHIPEFVQREFLSQQEDLISKDIDDIKSSAKSLLRKTRRKEITQYARQVIKDADEMLPTITGEMKEEFKKWITDSKARGQAISSDHSKRVIEDYFQGNPPFKVRKNRADIPDSYVWQAICDIAKRSRGLHAVCNDGALLEAARDKKGFATYKTLEVS